MMGASDYIVISAVTFWYFQQGGRRKKSYANKEPVVFTSVRSFFRYHFGTVGMGSILLTIFSLFKTMIDPTAVSDNL